MRRRRVSTSRRLVRHAAQMAHDIPVTMAVRVLRQHKVEFTPRLYKWEQGGGAAASSEKLGVELHQVVKTLIFERDDKTPLCILMHGDREVSAKELARVIGCKAVHPCKPDVAEKHSGYKVGGTSPFGLRRAMPVYVERSVLQLPRMLINGGARGFLVELAPAELVSVLGAIAVDVATT